MDRNDGESTAVLLELPVRLIMSRDCFGDGRKLCHGGCVMIMLELDSSQ